MADKPTSPHLASAARNDLAKRKLVLEEVEVEVISYRIGDRYSCTVENIDAGAVIARGSGPDRQTAEDAAIAQASMKLCLNQAGKSLHRSMETLRVAQRQLDSYASRSTDKGPGDGKR
jgi:hypothetical protein